MLSYVPEEIQSSIEMLFPGIHQQSFQFSSGGCINQAGVIDSSEGSLFIKWNTKSIYPEMFETEVKGLETLRSARCIRIPEVLYQGSTQKFSFLILENIEPAIRNKDFWSNLGSSLAALHKFQHKKFGLEYDNYIGSLRQINSEKLEWIEFYRVNRIEFQYKMAVDNGKMNFDSAMDRFFISIEHLFPEEYPCLIHGDLWSGNLMTDAAGNPVLIDPAVYYSNREMEIAYTRLFGGFEQEFYNVYEEAYPMEPGFSSRQDLYNLYPLLVHVNLFGGGYIDQAKHILQKFKRS